MCIKYTVYGWIFVQISGIQPDNTVKTTIRSHSDYINFENDSTEMYHGIAKPGNDIFFKFLP